MADQLRVTRSVALRLVLVAGIDDVERAADWAASTLEGRCAVLEAKAAEGEAAMRLAGEAIEAGRAWRQRRLFGE